VLNQRPDKKADKHDDAIVKRVSRKHDGDDHGGAWKVAFADFCLALMCLFLVLWLMAAREQERVQEVMRSPGGSVTDDGQGIRPEPAGGPRGSLIGQEPVPRRGEASVAGRALKEGPIDPSDPRIGPEAPKVRYESTAEMQALARMLARLGAEVGLAGNLQTIVTPYGLRVMLHDTDREGMFERGSAVPSERFRRLLRKLGPLFAQMDNQMLIVGHTDSLQYSDRGLGAQSNWTLSTSRATRARDELLAGGMAGSGILQVVGMADRAPIDTRDAAAAVNRRIELLVLTSAQARSIATMFGAPRDAQPLVEGADSSLPDGDALRALRGQLLDSRGGGPQAD
jgi:chemotaxis protein MotB